MAVTIQGTTYRRTLALPTTLDGSVPSFGTRTGRYGEVYTQQAANWRNVSADEGTYFMASNATPGTGITGATGTQSFSSTAAYLTLFNNNALLGATIYLDYLWLGVSVVGASATSFQAVFNVDSGNRYSSGGTALTAVRPNMDVTTGSSGAVVYAGAVVAAASTAPRQVGRRMCRSVALGGILFDQYMFHFGAPGIVTPQLAITTSTQQNMEFSMAPVVIGPQESFLFQPYWPAIATTGITYEVEIGWLERP